MMGGLGGGVCCFVVLGFFIFYYYDVPLWCVVSFPAHSGKFLCLL